MLTIKQDSEFMRNLLPASPISPGKRFVAFKDEQGHPAVFALGEDNKLNLFMLVDGKYAFIEFNTLWQLPVFISSFDLQQSADGSVYLVVSAPSSENASSVHIISGIKPADLSVPQPSKVIAAGSKYPKVFDIFISDFDQDIADHRIPFMFLSFAPPGAITASDQLGYLDAYLGQDGSLKFTLNTSWRLKTDPIKIISVTWSTCRAGQGAIVLYDSSAGLRLQFAAFKGSTLAVELKCPAKANSVSAALNPQTNASDLFVGGEQITYYTWQQYTKPFSPGTPLTSVSPALGIKDIYAVAGPDSWAIWFSSFSKNVQYYTAPVTSVTSGQLTPLFPDGHSTRISPLLSRRQEATTVDSVVSVDETGLLSLLECPQETGMWQAVPLYAPSPHNNIEVPSFTLRFRINSDNDDQPAPNCQLFLECSGVVSAQNNNKQVTIHQEGDWFEADEEGVLSIIVSTEDAAAYTFQVTKYKASATGGISPVGSYALNPNAKLNYKMTGIQSGADLLEARTQTGEMLIIPGSVDAKDANDAANILKDLNKQQILLGKPSTRLHKHFNGPRLHNPLGLTPEILCGRLPQDPSERAALIKELSTASSFSSWSVFRWVKDLAKDATTWFLDKIGDEITLIVTIAKNTFKFLLNSVEAIGKAVTWVFEKVKVGLQKLIDFLGFLFDWDDILTMTENVAIYFNVATDYGQDQLQYMKALKTQWINSLKTGTKEKQQPAAANSGPDADIPNNEAKLQETKDSVSYNWVGSRIKASGMDSQSSVTPTTMMLAGAHPGEPSLEQLWIDVQKIFDGLKQTAVDVGSNIKDLFKPGSTAGTVFSRMKDQFIDDMLGEADAVADLLLDAVALILKKLKDFVNAEVQIPIFSALWKFISKDKLKFTVLNALSLLLAIPSTILYKLVEKKSPPSLKGLTSAGFGDYINGKTSLTVVEGQLPISRKMFFVIEGVIAAHCLLIIPLFDQVKKLATWFTERPNIIDGGSLVFGCVLMFVGWPKAGSNDMNLRYGVWGLDISNTVALGLSCFARWASVKISREIAVKALAIWNVLSGIPRFVLRIIIIIRGYARDLSALIRYTIEDTLAIVKSIANAIKELVSEPNTKAAAEVVYWGSFAVSIIAKIVSVNVEAKDPPAEWGPLPEGIEWPKALMLATAKLDTVWQVTALSVEESRLVLQQRRPREIDSAGDEKAVSTGIEAHADAIRWDVKLVPVVSQLPVVDVD